MSLPKIPDLNPNINIERTDAINILIASIGLEELALSHILNAEGEKIQYVLGTLAGSTPGEVTIDNVLQINNSVNKTLRNVITTELLLKLKLEDALDLETPAPSPEPPEPTVYTVTYMRGDSGIGGPAQYTDIPSGSYTVRTLQEVGIAPVSTAYTFVSWQTPQGVNYAPGAVFVITSDMTLTAIWKNA